MRRIVAAFALGIVGAAGTVPLGIAGAQATPADTTTHNCRFVMVPMRDGVRLHTKVCEAKSAANAPAPLPIILNRTPYGISAMQAINGQFRFLACRPNWAARRFI